MRRDLILRIQNFDTLSVRVVANRERLRNGEGELSEKEVELN